MSSKSEVARDGEQSAGADKTNATSDEPYSAFTHGEKVVIVGIASFAALFR